MDFNTVFLMFLFCVCEWVSVCDSIAIYAADARIGKFMYSFGFVFCKTLCQTFNGAFFFSRILLILVIQTSFPSFFFVLLITDLVSRLQLQCRFKTFLFFLLFACAQYTLKLPIQNIVFVRHHARIAAGFRMYVECCGREISTPTENWLIFIFYHHKHTRTQNIEAKRDKELWGLWQVRDGDGGVVDARV